MTLLLLVLLFNSFIAGNCLAATAEELQQLVVTGTITDKETGDAMPGVNIQVKGTTIGVISDISGRYSINVTDKNALLVFSFIGYASAEVPLEGRSVADIAMISEAQSLDEVVVVGYGTQRKVTLTGSVAGIGSKEIVKTPSANISNSLSGLLPGLISLNRSGQPGSDAATILIRGRNTTGNNNPLVLVDGIVEPGWQRINSNDIESVSVLKDASAAIYGVQAANGVILITTKRGAAGKPVFDVSFNQGITRPTRIPEMASSATLAEYGNEFLMKQGGDPIWTAEEIQKFRDGSDPVNYPNTNWVKETFKNFSAQNIANLNVRGGGENVKYSLSGSYQHQGDMLKNGIHEFTGYTLRSNIDASISKDISMSLDINAGMDDRMSPQLGGVGRIYTQNPQYPVYWPGGYPSNPPSDFGYHPMINNTGGSGYNNRLEKRFSMKAGFNINIPWVKGLGVDGYFVKSDEYIFDKVWEKPWTYYGYDKTTGEVIPLAGGVSPLPNLGETFTNDNYNLINLRVKFEKQLNSHYISTFIAAEQSSGKYHTFNAYRKDFLSGAIEELFAGAVANMNTGGSSSENARQNLFGRVSYNFQEKYLLDFNFRYDGSYRFPKEGRWGFFPGVSVAWRISQEDFLKNKASYLDNLKLRASIGQIGNDQISAFQFLQGYNLRTLGYHFGSPSAAQAGIYAGVTPNPNITWEVATITNIGLDGQFLNNLIGFTLDVFKQRRSNILTTRDLAVPYFTGLVLPTENIGIVDNQGVELSLTHRNTLAGGLTYTLSGNIAYSKNKVVDVSEPTDVPDYQKSEGHILGAGLYYEAIGIFRTQEQLDANPVYVGTIVGDLQYRDFNGDGSITAADRVRMDKSIIPQITYGYNLSLDYRNFTLFAHFSGQARAYWYIFQNARVSLNTVAELLENRYTPGSMDSKYPWIPQMEGPGREVSGLESTFWLQNAAFMRLKSLELSYTLPAKFLSAIRIDRLRIFANGSNLFTISDIKWYDPEGDNTQGTFYPQTKIYNLGLQLTF